MSATTVEPSEEILGAKRVMSSARMQQADANLTKALIRLGKLNEEMIGTVNYHRGKSEPITRAAVADIVSDLRWETLAVRRLVALVQTALRPAKDKTA